MILRNTTGGIVMNLLHSVQIPSIYGDKFIRVYHADATCLPLDVDVLGVSARPGAYLPSPNTLIDALWRRGIHVHEMARQPDIDMRRLCKVWLSAPIKEEFREDAGSIGRIACIEFSQYSKALDNQEAFEKSIISKTSAFFRMLDAAEHAEVPLNTVAMPMLGGGAQGIRFDLILVPLLREIIDYLLRSKVTRQVLLVDKSERTAYIFAAALKSDSFRAHLKMACGTETLSHRKQAFISYAHQDRPVVELLCEKIQQRGLDVWVDKQNIIEGVYADRIAKAIRQSGIFIPVMSRYSLYSPHVLTEVNMAFNRMSSARLFLPLFVDRSQVTPAFEYYLNAIDCTYALPPTQNKLDEFIEKILKRYNEVTL